MTLGIDIGTYSSKAVLVDQMGSVIAEAQTPHEMSVPKPGYAEHDAEELWYNDMVVLCGMILSQAEQRHGISASRISAVAVSAIAPCVLPVDRKGKPLRPAILYGVDARAQLQITRLNGTYGPEWIQNHSGTTLSAQSAGPKILWIQDEEPHLAEQTWKYMTSTTYLVFRLTGEVVIDHYTAAFYDPLYDLKNQSWSTVTLEGICRPDQLPELRWTTEQAGNITAQAAAATGLVPGTPVIVGTADAASEAISAGVTRAGETMLMYGSSMFLIALKERLPEPGIFWSAPFLFPETYALAAGMATTGSLTQWFRNNFAQQEFFAEKDGGQPVYDALAELAATAPTGSEGVITLPYFSGERTPINDSRARGVVAGVNLTTTRAHLYRSILEGVAYGIRHNLETMGSSRHDGDTITAVGGGTRNDLWVRIVSDVLGKTQLVQTTNGAAYGNAMLAALSCGVITSADRLSGWVKPAREVHADPANTEIYDRYYPLFLELYRSSASVVHSLVELAQDHRTGRGDENRRD